MRWVLYIISFSKYNIHVITRLTQQLQTPNLSVARGQLESFRGCCHENTWSRQWQSDSADSVVPATGLRIVRANLMEYIIKINTCSQCRILTLFCNIRLFVDRLFGQEVSCFTQIPTNSQLVWNYDRECSSITSAQFSRFWTPSPPCISKGLDLPRPLLRLCNT